MLRYDDRERVLTLSVLDLVERIGASGHLRLEVVQSSAARMAAGREVHAVYQADRGGQDEAFQAEVRLRHQIGIGEWTVVLWGRVDGLTIEDGRTVVEEVKSTALDADRLYGTRASDWPRYAAQLALYLWMLVEAQPRAGSPGLPGEGPTGRLVLVSLSDGSRHVIGLDPDERVAKDAMVVLERLVQDREERLQWMARRQKYVVPEPFDAWRAGQSDVTLAVETALADGKPALVEAPTGMGKTGAVLYAALRYAMGHDKQIFWATARTTQQIVAEAAVARFRAKGLLIRSVTIGARERYCVNSVISCNPETCRFAERYHDKVRERDVLRGLADAGGADAEGLRRAGRADEVCPHELGLDLTGRADVVIGDYNYVFDPGGYLKRAFGEEADRWIVVVDEAHQLVERARGYASPKILAETARKAIQALSAAGPRFAAFQDLAAEILDRMGEAADTAEVVVDEEAVIAPSPRIWRDLADRIDEVGLDYALLAADRPLVEPGEEDPWQDLARSVLRFAGCLGEAGENVVPVAVLRPGEESIGLLCLDPSGWMGPRIADLGGFVGVSATLSPTAFHRDLLGLDPDVHTVRVASPFPPENRRVVIAPRVSTAFKDREKQAAPTAALMERCIEAVPGNVAAYFPSFVMLRDIASRWALPGRELLLQEPAMPEARRREWLERLGQSGPPVVLAAVLGGIFAEGIDLAPGALSAVLVCGPALPPVGLERNLLREHYETRYGEGFRYASLVPGMTRVVQAAGRLVRRPEDRGVVVLFDRRFRWREYRELLPTDWEIDVPDDPAAAVLSFFQATRA